MSHQKSNKRKVRLKSHLIKSYDMRRLFLYNGSGDTDEKMDKMVIKCRASAWFVEWMHRSAD